MNTNHLLPKLFFGSLIWTVGFLGLAGFAAERATESDPELKQKLESKYDFHLDLTGTRFFGFSGHSSHMQEAQDSWSIKVPRKKLSFKVISANISIKNTGSEEILVTAGGKIDKQRAPKLLEVEVTDDEVRIQEPHADATEGLTVNVELPASFAQDLDITSVSGSISVEGLTLKALDAKTVSGDLALEAVSCQNLFLKSVSGDIQANNSAIDNVEGKSVSGSLHLHSTVLTNIDFSSISGDVKLNLPKAESVEFKLKSVSGEIKNAHSSSEKGHYHVQVHTTSGEIIVE